MRRDSGRARRRPEMWEFCIFNTFVDKVTYCSWSDGYDTLRPREYLTRFHPGWLKENPKRDGTYDVIMVLLGLGWEPYAANGSDLYFRRKVNS
jgi:hypothetical protein